MKFGILFSTIITSVVSIITPNSDIKKSGVFENYQIKESWGFGIKVGQQETSPIYSLREPNYNSVKTIEKNPNDDIESNIFNFNPIQYVNASDFSNTFLVFDFTYGPNDSNFINSSTTFLRLYSQDNEFISNLYPNDYLNEKPLSRNISTANWLEDEHLTILSNSYLSNDKRLSLVKLSDILEIKTLSKLYLTLRIVINNSVRNFSFSIILDKTNRSLFAYELDDFNTRIVPRIRRSNLEYGWWDSESQKDGNQLNTIINGTSLSNGPLNNTSLSVKSNAIIFGLMDKVNELINRKINRFTCEYINLEGVNQACQISLYYTEDNPSYLRTLENNTFQSVRWLKVSQEGVYRFRTFEFSEYNNSSYNPITYTINIVRTKALLDIRNNVETILDNSSSLRFVTLSGYHPIGGQLKIVFNNFTSSVELSLDNSRQLTYEFTRNGSYQISFLDYAGNEGLLNGKSTLTFVLNIPDPSSISLRDRFGNNLSNGAIVNTAVTIDFYANVDGTLTITKANSTEVINKNINSGQYQEIIKENGAYQISFLDISGKSGVFSDNSNEFNFTVELPPIINATIVDESGSSIVNNQIVYSTVSIAFTSSFPSTINIYRNISSAPFDQQLVPAGGLTVPYSFFSLGNITVEIIDIAGRQAIINNESNSLSFEMFTPYIGAFNIMETLYNRPLNDENNISYQNVLISFSANSATTIILTKDGGAPVEFNQNSGDIEFLITEDGNYVLQITKVDGKLMTFPSGKNYFDFQIIDVTNPLVTIQSQDSIITMLNSSIPSEIYISYYSPIESKIHVELNGVLKSYPQSSGNVSLSLSSIGFYELSVTDDLNNHGIFEDGSDFFQFEIIDSTFSEFVKLPILDWISFDNQSFINIEDIFDYIKTNATFAYRSGMTNLDSIKSNITVIDSEINSKSPYENFSFVSIFWIFNQRTYLHTTEVGIFEFLRTEILKESEKVNFFTNGSTINFSISENYYLASGLDLFRFKNAKITLEKRNQVGIFQSILNEQILSGEYLLDEGFYNLSIKFVNNLVFNFNIKISSLEQELIVHDYAKTPISITKDSALSDRKIISDRKVTLRARNLLSSESSSENYQRDVLVKKSTKRNQRIDNSEFIDYAAFNDVDEYIVEPTPVGMSFIFSFAYFDLQSKQVETIEVEIISTYEKPQVIFQSDNTSRLLNITIDTNSNNNLDIFSIEIFYGGDDIFSSEKQLFDQSNPKKIINPDILNYQFKSTGKFYVRVGYNQRFYHHESFTFSTETVSLQFKQQNQLNIFQTVAFSNNQIFYSNKNIEIVNNYENVVVQILYSEQPYADEKVLMPYNSNATILSEDGYYEVSILEHGIEINDLKYILIIDKTSPALKIFNDNEQIQTNNSEKIESFNNLKIYFDQDFDNSIKDIYISYPSNNKEIYSNGTINQLISLDDEGAFLVSRNALKEDVSIIVTDFAGNQTTYQFILHSNVEEFQNNQTNLFQFLFYVLIVLLFLLFLLFIFFNISKKSSSK